MRATTIRERVALRWTDGHEVDPARFPVEAGPSSGSYLATVRGTEVELRWTGGRWTVCVGGVAVAGMLDEETLRGARSAVAAALRSPGDVARVLDAEGRRRIRAHHVQRAIDAIEEVDATPAGTRGAHAARFTDSLRAVLAEAARLGYAVGADGAIVETWRARARRRWIDGKTRRDFGVTRPRPSSFLRIEAGRVLEVYPTDAPVAEAKATPESVEWTVAVDGDLVATILGLAAAQAFAVATARKAGAR